MKTKNILALAFFLVIGFGIIAASLNYAAKELKKAKDFLPEDMILINGGNGIEDFYMGVSEETNMHWKMYVGWLQRVYFDYPEVYHRAQRRNFVNTDFLNFNDPYVMYYADHPAYAYYPVTGVSWKQVQDYLGWKTDRLNEYVLISLEKLYLDCNQANDESFDTEAYLADMYEGLVRNAVVVNTPEGILYRKLGWSDRVFFPGFRLPTEEEWEYAAKKDFQKPFTGENESKYGKSPYGKDYYLFKWGTVEGGGIEYDYLNYIEKMSFTYNPALDNMQRISSVRSYEKDFYGVCNMEGNVREYLADYFKEEKTGIKNWVDVYKSSGFHLNPVLTDTGGLIYKDSLGDMHYRILGENKEKEPIMLGIDYKKSNQNIVVKGGTWKNPGTYRMSFHPDSASIEIGFRCVLSRTSSLR